MEERDFKLLNDVLASDNFSDQEKQIIKGRFEKTEKTEAFITKYQQGGLSSIELMDSIDELLDEQCEHGRSMMGECSDCFMLEKKVVHLHPELFKDDPACADLFADE